eukprot:g15436.t1
MYDALHYFGKAFRQHPDLLQTAKKVTEFNFFYADRTYYLCNAAPTTASTNPSPCPTCTAAEVRSAIVFDVKPRINAAFPDARETVSTFFSSRGEAVSVSSTDLVEEAVQVLKRDLLHLDDYILKYLTDDESCVQPGDLIQPSMREIARRSQVNMARLHVLQLHYLEQPSPSSSCTTCLGVGMQPWGLDYRLQTKRRTRVKYRFHGVAVQVEPQLQLVQKNDHELKYSSLENYAPDVLAWVEI